MASVQHALKDGIGIRFAARRAQGVFIIHPSEDDDPGFRVKPEEKSETPAYLCPAPVTKSGAHRIALAVLLAIGVARYRLENQFRERIEEPHIRVRIKARRILLLGSFSGDMKFLQLLR